MKIPRCACRWCGGRPPYWDGPDDVEAFTDHALSCSGPFDESKDVHPLALAVKTLLGQTILKIEINDTHARPLREAVGTLDAVRLRTATFSEIQLAYFAVENAARAVLDRVR